MRLASSISEEVVNSFIMDQERKSSDNLALPQMKYHDRSPIVRFANRRFLSTIALFLRSIRFNSLLDAGCGEGVVLASIRNEFQSGYLGLDLDYDRVRFASMEMTGNKFVNGDAQRLPFPEASFDLVLLLEVLEHVGDPERVLEEVHRVSGKYLLASVPNEPWWRVGNVLRLKYMRDFGNTPEHINHWTIPGFRTLLSERFHILAMRLPMLWTFILAEKM